MRKLIWMLLVSACLAQSTPNLNFNIPSVGTPAWGPLVNANFTLLDGLLSGAGVLPGLKSKVVNGVVYADLASGADFCQKVLTASQVSGVAIVDASGFAGTAQACGSPVTLAASSVLYKFPPNLTVTFAAGVTITLSGNDVYFVGAGDTTLFDFSAGPSFNPHFIVQGSRNFLGNFKVNGNRVSAGTSAALQIIPSATTLLSDRNTIQYLTLSNIGGTGIYYYNQSNLRIYNNSIATAGTSCIFGDRTGNQNNTGIRIDNNVLSDCNLSATGGHGGIMVNTVVATDQQDHWITANKITNVTGSLLNRVGIGFNGGKTVRISGNRLIGTGNGGGEGIAVTAIDFKITENQVSGFPVCGILFYAISGMSSDGVIQGNESQSNNQGLCLVWGANSITISGISIYGNRLKNNTTYGLQTYNGAAFTSPAVKNLAIFGNTWLGNTVGTTSLLAVTGDYLVYGNTDVDNDNTFRVSRAGILSAAQVNLGSSTFSNLGTPVNGTTIYCTDCNSTCSAGASTGRTCFRENGAWVH